MSEYQYYEFTAVDKPLNEKEMALARDKYLESLSGQEDSIWKKVDKNIDSKQPATYDEAVKLLVDLRDLYKKKRPERKPPLIEK